MGYIIKRRKTTWSLLYRVEHGKAGTEERVVKVGTTEFRGLGLFPEMTLEEAKTAVERYRKNAELTRLQERRARFDEDKKKKELIESAFLPRHLVAEFEQVIVPESGLRMDRWLICKTLIAKLEVPPDDWHWRPAALYRLFWERGDELRYASRLLRIINKWGAFFCKKTGKAFLPVEPPKGEHKKKIQAEHNRKGAGRNRGTKPMLLSHLDRAKAVLPLKQYNGLLLMFWAGLRFEELRMILDDKRQKKWRLQFDDPRGFPVLHVYQEKLERQGIKEELCWKAIPLCESEQPQLVKILQDKKIEPPSIKRLRPELGFNLTNRSARRGFTKLLQYRGYSQKCWQSWLGHVGKDTSELHYESKAVAYYEPPIRKAA